MENTVGPGRAGLLETQRRAHELIERLQEQIAKESQKPARKHIGRLAQQHRILRMMNRIQQLSAFLLETYADASGARKKEVASISNAGNSSDFSEFYNRLKDIKDYHRKHPEEKIEILELEVAKVNEDQEFDDIENMFSGEEARGRFLDLNIPFETYVNLKNVKRINYLAYINVFDKFDEESYGVSAKIRKTVAYKQYLVQLVQYLEGFCKRALPLLDVELIRDSAAIETEQWARTQTDEFDRSSDSSLYCKPCCKLFSSKQVFDHHLPGKKHQKALAEDTASRQGDVEKDKQQSAQLQLLKEIKFNESFVRSLAQNLAAIREDTRDLVERKQTLSADEIEKAKALYDEQDFGEEEEEHFSAEEEEEEENTEIYNPLKLPMGWDGKPIPYWLYKLHGLGVEYPCEICGNFIYMGRKAFDRHFQEWRHAHGMRCLGIPNTKHFQEITRIQDAYALHEKLTSAKKAAAFKAEAMEEFEDAEGNVFNKKTFE
ncbi:hypothetical protein HDU84_006547, partial [Entophlyctis sp. JEL0112]